MKITGKLFVFSILSLIVVISNSSCISILGKDEKPVVVNHTKVIRLTILECPKPQKPKYEKLDENKPLTSPDNLNRLLNNLVEMKSYLNSLEFTVKCYEDQLNYIQSQIEKYNKEESNDGK